MSRKPVAAIAVTLAGMMLLASAPAVAAPGNRAGVYSTWTGATPSAVRLVAGFPAATIASSDPSLSVASTATLAGATPPGVIYGTSSGYQHLSLSPLSVGGGVWEPTSTTLTFESPTPAYGWSFILGDIDSETLTVSATGPGGALSGDELGFVSSFDVTPPEVLVSWDPATGQLSAPTGDDTTGSSAWFSPAVPFTTLTITTTRRQGSPTAYLWLAAQTASLAGIVTDDRTGTPRPVPAVPVEISSPGGSTLPGSEGVPLVAISDESGGFDVEVFPAPVELSSESADGVSSEIVTVLPEPLETDASLFNFPQAVSVRILPAVIPAQLPPTGVDAASIVSLSGLALLGGVGLVWIGRSRRASRVERS